MSGLAGRSVLVTGGGSGIGRAVAVRLATAGARVVVADLDASAAADTAAQATSRAAVEQSGGECVSCAVDVSDESGVERAISFVVHTFGRLDCAVNCAGIEGARAATHESTTDNWDAVMGVNARGCYLCMRAEINQVCAPRVLSQRFAVADSARVILISCQQPTPL